MHSNHCRHAWIWATTFCASLVLSIPLELSSTASVTSALQTLSWDIMSIYQGNLSGQIPGLWPYYGLDGIRMYWWESGALWGSMINYWYLTGDDTYNDEITQGLLFQATSAGTFEPANQSSSLGNDDQSFWAYATLEAAEYNFPNPPASDFQWLELSQAVFNRQAGRWDTSTCNGGLRWQVYWWEEGYTYKNSPSNGGLFQMAARLAKFTGNQTYADWAEKVYSWMEAVQLIGSNGEVYDGTSDTINCTQVDHDLWSYNGAIMVYGAAVMWNITNHSSIWYDRTQLLLQGMSVFFPDGILSEISCEHLAQSCNEDQQSFKAYVGRFLAVSTLVAPFTYSTIQPWLEKSAIAAAATCTGDGGTWCGLAWTSSTFDGIRGVGEQMAVMEAVGAQLMYSKPGPLTAKTGGTSKGNAAAGGSAPLLYPGFLTSTITLGDRVGAAMATAVIGCLFAAGAVFMMRD